MCRMDLVDVAIDERLKDASNVRPDRGAVCVAAVVRAGRDIRLCLCSRDETRDHCEKGDDGVSEHPDLPTERWLVRGGLGLIEISNIDIDESGRSRCAASRVRIRTVPRGAMVTNQSTIIDVQP